MAYAPTFRRRNKRDGGTGRASRPSSKRCTRTGGGCGASTARVYCGGAVSWWSVASRTVTRRAGCGAAIWRGQENILKRQLVHVGAFNLSLILRQLLGAGTPREWKNRFGRRVLTLYFLFTCRINQKLHRSRTSASVAKCFVRSRTRLRRPTC